MKQISVRITAMVTDPLDSLAKNPKEMQYHVIYLNRYPPFPFDSLPRNYKKAVEKFGLSKIEANGVLPWQIGVYSAKLTEAFRQRNWKTSGFILPCWRTTWLKLMTLSTPLTTQTASERIS